MIGLLIARLYLALTRYIDPDEFAHLHWAYLLSQGSIPYKDFFINFTPLYHLLLLPVFWLPQSSTIVIAARLFQFLLSGLTLFLLYTFVIQITNHRFVGLVAIIIFLAFPMILDKSIELRPDLLMTVWLLAALVAIGKKERWSWHRALMVGISTGLSLLTLVKILYALPATGVYFAYHVPKNMRLKLFLWMGIGIMVPIACYSLYLVWNGTSQLAYENIVHGSQLIKRGEGTFSPWLSFSPIPLVYVDAGGPSVPWLANTVIWIVAVAGLFVFARKNRPAAFVFFLFLAAGITSLFVFPTPYLQYFIPLSVFISVLAAITVHTVGKPLLQGLFLVLLFLSFSQQYRGRIRNTNEEQRKVIDDVLRISKPSETFYDMVGSYVFRPDGYYVCCNEYARFAHLLPFPVPTLRESLVGRKTKFIVLDRVGKSLWLPSPNDLSFILSNYLPTKYNKLYSLGFQFRCTNGACVQHTINNQPASNRSTSTFTILLPEIYTVTAETNSEAITVDGQTVRNGQAVSFAAGIHRFSASPAVTSLRIQLSR